MGRYLNPDNSRYLNFIDSRFQINGVFVDKSLVIEKINCIFNGEDKYLCVSRPRRFGKTLIMSLLVAFYSKGCDSREIFSNLKIAQTSDWDKNLNKYNVIKLDIQDILSEIDDYADLVKTINEYLLSEMKSEYPNINFDGITKVKIAIRKIYDETKEKFIIIIDEYDVLIREGVKKDILKPFLEFLNGLFKGDSTQDSIALGYITGILPVINGDKVQSKLNMFQEYSIVEPGTLAGYVGFTEDEVNDVCIKHNMDFEEMKSWYNGYNVDGIAVYNPNSICEAVRTRNYTSHWGITGTFEVVADYIAQNKKLQDKAKKKNKTSESKAKQERNIIDEVAEVIAGGKIKTPIVTNKRILNLSNKSRIGRAHV